MSRLGYVGNGTSPDIDALYGRVAGMGRPVLNLYRALANQPPALDAFLGMSRYVRDGSSLDPVLRELVILATAHELGQAYEIAHHTEAAVRAGASRAKLAAVAPGGSDEAMSAAERCAIDFAREVTAKRACDDRTFRRLESYFSPPEIVDMVVTVAWYHLCAAILGPLEIELEPGKR